MLRDNELILREVREEDIDLFVKWTNDFEIFKYFNRQLPLTKSAEKEWFNNLHRGEEEAAFTIEIEDLNDIRPIGKCGLHDIDHFNRSAEILILIGDKNCQGKGYGPRAIKLLVDYGFSRMNLHRIRARIFDFNPRSIKMFEKIGFTQEGVEYESIFHEGQYHNTLSFYILKNQ